MTIRNDRLAWKERFRSGCNLLDFALRNFMAAPGPSGALPEAVLETARLESLTMLEWLRFARQNAPEAFNAFYPRHVLHPFRHCEAPQEPWQSPAQEYAGNAGDCHVGAAPLLAMTETMTGTMTETQVGKNSPFRWLDVGAKNWAYAAGLAAFLKEALPEGESACIDGVEIDPNRRTTDLRTRRQTAEALLASLAAGQSLIEPALSPNLSKEGENARRQDIRLAYHAGDILHWQTSAHIITHFLPFVAIDPLLAWGLPSEHFKPQAILEHLLDNLLLPGGLLFVVNQGEAEASIQEALFAEASKSRRIRALPLGELPCKHIPYRYPRYGWICTHD